jgi:hypothetical protein
MSVTWGSRPGRVNELKDIEVDEVSLVDRPATGKRFVLFKRANRVPTPASEEDANKCSCGAEALRKRADDADAEIRRLAERAERLEKRLDAIESARPERQSDEPARPRGLWAGIL